MLITHHRREHYYDMVRRSKQVDHKSTHHTAVNSQFDSAPRAHQHRPWGHLARCWSVAKSCTVAITSSWWNEDIGYRWDCSVEKGTNSICQLHSNIFAHFQTHQVVWWTFCCCPRDRIHFNNSPKGSTVDDPGCYIKSERPGHQLIPGETKIINDEPVGYLCSRKCMFIAFTSFRKRPSKMLCYCQNKHEMWLACGCVSFRVKGTETINLFRSDPVYDFKSN